MKNKPYFPELVSLLKKAGSIIKEIENSSGLNIRYKDDNSPVTRADMQSDRIIRSGLKLLFPSIPVISEEFQGEEISDISKFWLLDPVDGTKEFIAGNGEYCISLALIDKGIPVEGYIYAPRSDEFWFAERSKGAYKFQDNMAQKIPAVKTDKEADLVLLRSRSHHNKPEEDWFNSVSSKYGIEIKLQGSAIKFCRMAEGKGDLYIKKGRIYAWDIAAGNLILSESGGDIIAFPDGRQIKYLSSDPLMPYFVAYSDRIKDAEKFLI